MTLNEVPSKLALNNRRTLKPWSERAFFVGSERSEFLSLSLSLYLSLFFILLKIFNFSLSRAKLIALLRKVIYYKRLAGYQLRVYRKLRYTVHYAIVRCVTPEHS